MSACRRESTPGKLARVAPFVPVGTLAFLLGHAMLYSLLSRGVLGRTPPLLMAIPVPIYFLAALAMLALAVWMLAKRRLAALWYMLAGLLAVGGLVMAINELNQFLMVA